MSVYFTVQNRATVLCVPICLLFRWSYCQYISPKQTQLIRKCWQYILTCRATVLASTYLPLCTVKCCQYIWYLFIIRVSPYSHLIPRRTVLCQYICLLSLKMLSTYSPHLRGTDVVNTYYLLLHQPCVSIYCLIRHGVPCFRARIYCPLCTE